MPDTPANQNLFSLMERVYALALLEEAEKQGDVATTSQQIRDLLEVVTAEPRLLELAQSRVLGITRRAESVRRIFQGKVSDLVLRFLLVLNDRNRLDEFPGIARAYLHIEEERHGILQADAYIASEMDQALAQKVAARISELSKRQVVLTQHIDPRLLGGLKLRIHDTVVDGSVATQLRRLHDRLVEAGRERAKQVAAGM